jgi:hypothetical protein
MGKRSHRRRLKKVAAAGQPQDNPAVVQQLTLGGEVVQGRPGMPYTDYDIPEGLQSDDFLLRLRGLPAQDRGIKLSENGKSFSVHYSTKQEELQQWLDNPQHEGARQPDLTIDGTTFKGVLLVEPEYKGHTFYRRPPEYPKEFFSNLHLIIQHARITGLLDDIEQTASDHGIKAVIYNGNFCGFSVHNSRKPDKIQKFFDKTPEFHIQLNPNSHRAQIAAGNFAKNLFMGQDAQRPNRRKPNKQDEKADEGNALPQVAGQGGHAGRVKGRRQAAANAANGPS